MKKSFKTKFLSLFLSILMLFCMMPQVALADSATVTPSSSAELEEALKSTTPKTIEINSEITLSNVVTVGANHTLSITSGSAIFLSGSCNLEIPSETNLTVNGGSFVCYHNDSFNGTFTVNGTLTLNDVDFEVKSQGNKVAGKLIATDCNIKIANTSDMGILILGELEISGGDLNVSNTDGVGIYTYHSEPISIRDCIVELNSKGDYVTAIYGDMYVENSEVSIKIAGDDSSIGIDYGKNMIFDNSTVTIANSGQSKGIRGYGIDTEFKIINESTISVESQAYGTGIFIAPSSGTASLVIDDSILEFCSGGNYALNLQNGAEIKGENYGKITFHEGSSIIGIKNKIKDRDVIVTSDYSITVGPSSDPAAANAISEGTYTWEGTHFSNTTTTPTAITFTAEQTGGVSGTADSTGINITFSEVVTGLTADKISITDGTGAAVKGTLSGSGSSYTISLTSVTTEGTVNLSIANFGSYSVTTPSQTVNVYKNTVVTPTEITFTAEQIGGMSGMADSIGINITFSEVVTGFTADKISITDGTGVAVKGTLSGSGTDYTISLTSVTTEGTVNLSIDDFGRYSITTPSQAVNVYKNTVVNPIEEALKSTTPKTIEINSTITLSKSVTVGANHTLSIASGGEIILAGYCNLNIPSETNLTVNGGSLVCDYSDSSNGTFTVDGTLTLNDVDFEVKSQLNQVKGKLIATDCNIKITNTSDMGIIISDGELKISGGDLNVINTGGAGIYTLDNELISISDCIVVLNSKGDYVTAICGDMYVENSEVSIEINGDSNSYGINYDSLIFDNCEVTLANKDSSIGIYSYGKDSELKIINGSTMRSKHQGVGTSISIDPTSIPNTASFTIDDSVLELCFGDASALYLQNGAEIKGNNYGKIIFQEGSKISGLQNKIKDRDVIVTSNSLTVGPSSAPASENAISAGTYTWDGTHFSNTTATPTEITFTAEQTGGISGTADSTGINITFSEVVTGLTADEISITDGTGAVMKGILSGSGSSYTISLTSVTTEGTVNLAIANFGSYSVTTPPQTVNVYKNTVVIPTEITFTAEQTGGASGTADSTGINITFSEVVTGLTADEISITDGTGAAVKGTLSGSGTDYTISLTSVTTEGTVNLRIANFGSYSVTTPIQTVNVYKNTVVNPIEVTFTAVQTGGASGTSNSTGINITFSEDVTGLTADKISIIDDTGAAIKGTLSGSGSSYIISLTSVTAEGLVHLKIVNFGSYKIMSPPQALYVYKNTVVTPKEVTFTAVQTGGVSGTKNSTGINITFSEDVTGLTEFYVTIIDGTGAAIKGLLSGSGSNYTISLTSVTTEGIVYLGIGDFEGYRVTSPAQRVEVYKNTATGNNPGAGSSGSVSPKSDSNVVNGNTINATAKETDGILTSNISTNNISDAIKNVDESKDNIINIVIDPKEEIDTIKVTIANEGWKQLAQNDNMSLQINAGGIILTLDNTAIKEIYKQAKKDIIIKVGPVDKSELTKQQQNSVGKNQAYNLSIISDNKVISEFKGNIAVKLPYDINSGENADSIIVYHVGSDGMIKIVKNATYNAITKTVDFNTSHFSVYMIGYNYTEFSDVTSEFWAKQAIDFASARNLVAGVGNNRFEPNRAITRAEFTQMLYNVFTLDTIDTTEFKDVKLDAWYYTAIMSCKKAGFFDKLSILDDEFMPNQVITREEMAVILSNVAKYCNVLSASKATADLTKFSDYDNIDKNFVDDIILAINLGLLDKNGIGSGKFDPKGSTTRAQAAQIQKNILYILNIAE